MSNADQSVFQATTRKRPIRFDKVIPIRYGDGYSLVCKAARLCGLEPSVFVRQSSETAAREVLARRRSA